MATGLEIVAIKDGKARLYKVRHDGYAIEDYISHVKVPQGTTTLDAIKHFKEWFFSPSNYGPENPLDSDIQTNYPDGFEFIPKGLAAQMASEMISNAEDDLQDLLRNNQLPNGATDEGFLCGYADWVVLFDLDNGGFVIEGDSEESEERDNQPEAHDGGIPCWRKKQEEEQTMLDEIDNVSKQEEKQLSPQEQLEAMRLYVQSMQKVSGHTNENVRDILEAVYKRFLVVLNYSPLAKAPEMKEVKGKFKEILEDEQARYKDEEQT